MKATFKGYTLSVTKEINSRIESQEIQALVDAKFEPIERRVFYTMLYCSLAIIITIPTILSLI